MRYTPLHYIYFFFALLPIFTKSLIKNCGLERTHIFLQLENHGMIKTAVGIAKQEGALKLWSGLMPMFQRHAIYSGCRLIFYEHFRNLLKDDKGKVSLGAASLGEKEFNVQLPVVYK